MDEPAVTKIITKYLTAKSADCGTQLAIVPNTLRQHLFGWSFTYQSKSFLETDDFLQMLVGQGPVVALRDGRIFEGGSLDSDADAVLRRFNIAPLA